MFKIAKIKLIPDPEMYIFFEKGTRGEISSISNRYIKVNNKYLKPYDIKKKKTYLFTHFQQVDSNGQTQKSFNWINILAIVQKDVF